MHITGEEHAIADSVRRVHQERIAQLEADNKRLAEEKAELDKRWGVAFSEEYIAWMVYKKRGDNPNQPYLSICHSDTPGAFRVYRKPTDQAHGLALDTIDRLQTDRDQIQTTLREVIAAGEAMARCIRFKCEKEDPLYFGRDSVAAWSAAVEKAKR